LERNITRDGELDLGAGTCVTGNFEQPADSRGSLAHPGKSPVSFSPTVEHLCIDSAAVVPNSQAQVTVDVIKFKIDALGSGMTKGVNKSLSTDAIDLLFNCWPQRLLLADNTGPEVHTGLGQKFLTNSGQSRREGPRTR